WQKDDSSNEADNRFCWLRFVVDPLRLDRQRGGEGSTLRLSRLRCAPSGVREGTLAARCLAFALVCSALAMPAWAGHTLTAQEQKVLQSWLAHHPEYRAATDEDCDCADDFKGDGVRDFAVVVLDRSKQEKNFALVVFNGPFKSETAAPAFLETGLDLS